MRNVVFPFRIRWPHWLALLIAQLLWWAPSAQALEVRRLDTADDGPAAGDWEAVARHEGFWMYKPRDGVVAPLRTSVQAACDRDALFFRIIADGAGSGGVRAPVSRRDQIGDDQDHVTVFVDTVGDGESAYFFRVNPSASIADGTYTAISDNMDFHPDYGAQALRLPATDGYALQIRIPRADLRDRGAGAGARAWRYLVVRNVPGAERMVFTSGELKQNTTNVLVASQTLDSGQCPGAQGEWSAGINATVRRHRSAVDGSPSDTETDTRLGAHFKWNNGAHLGVNATYRPDFSQVELDIPQLQSNAQYALFLPEKRDFFLEDIDLLELPTRSSLQGGGGGLAVYTRTITDPLWGARMSYRNQGRSFTALAVRDVAGGVVAIPNAFGTGFVRQPRSLLVLQRASVARGEWQFGEMLSHRDYGNAGENTVAAVDASWQPNEITKARAMLLFTSTTAQASGDGLRRGERVDGQYAFVDWARLGRHWETSLTLERANSGLRNDTGFMPQSDFAQITGVVTRKWRFDGAWSSVSAFLWTAHAQTASTGETLLTRYAPGVWLSGPYDLQLIAEYHPGERRRVAGYGAQLHKMDQWYFQASSSVSRTLPAASFEITLGDQLDYATDTLGTGYVATLSGKYRPTAWFEAQPRITYWYMDAPSRGVHTRETSAQLLANVNFDTHSFLRLILQYGRNRRREPIGPLPPGPIDPLDLRTLDSRGNVQSLVYSNNSNRRFGFDIGATRSENTALDEPGRYVLDLFAKVVVTWH